jgi:dihydroorotate dehydrogenase electron transfer subunit
MIDAIFKGEGNVGETQKPNRQNDHLFLLQALLQPTGWRVRAETPDSFLQQGLEVGTRPDLSLCPSHLVVASKSNQSLVFCLAGLDREYQAQLARAIPSGSPWGENLPILVADRYEQMEAARTLPSADYWPGGLFTCTGELEKLIGKLPVEIPEGSSTQCTFPQSVEREVSPEISNFEAEVLSNIRIGGSGSCHYKMRFRAPGLREAFPGQFIMMDTRPRTALNEASWEIHSQLNDRINLTPQAFLKRPFGILQTFFPHFPAPGFAGIVLPSAIAPALRWPHPAQFEILYKVLEGGVGTREMMDLKPGDLVQMLGPLGKRYDVSRLSERGIQEVHLVGGGVGTVPLVLIAHWMRSFGFKVKVFIGIESWESLHYHDDIERSFGTEPRAAYVYVDELLAAGLSRQDLFVTCDRPDALNIEHLVPASNFAHGFISGLYQSYLDSAGGIGELLIQKQVAAFACGPHPMMKAIWKICLEREIPLNVLMEKRMACGVGVCLSCVCSTISPDGTEKYQRVCSDGPIFDARELKWE